MPAPVAAPVAAPVPAAVPAQRSPGLDISGCYERSWNLLKGNFWTLFGVGALTSAIFSALGYVQMLLPFIVTPILGAVLIAGVFYFLLLKIRGQPAGLADAFAGFTRSFLTLILVGIIVPIFLVVGLCCLVLPGLYLLVAYTFTPILAVDKGLGFWEAMETSRRTITRQWWQVLGLLLLGIPFLLLGLAAFGVGIFVAIPFVAAAVAYAYEDLCSQAK